MTGQIIPFPVGCASRATPCEKLHPYDFWFPLLHDMRPAQRRATIEQAHRCGVIDERDREIFLTSWLDQEGTQ